MIAASIATYFPKGVKLFKSKCFVFIYGFTAVRLQRLMDQFGINFFIVLQIHLIGLLERKKIYPGLFRHSGALKPAAINKLQHFSLYEWNFYYPNGIAYICIYIIFTISNYFYTNFLYNFSFSLSFSVDVSVFVVVVVLCQIYAI